MPQERLPNKLYLPKQMGEDQLEDLELDAPIALRILDGIAWDQARRFVKIFGGPT